MAGLIRPWERWCVALATREVRVRWQASCVAGARPDPAASRRASSRAPCSWWCVASSHPILLLPSSHASSLRCRTPVCPGHRWHPHGAVWCARRPCGRRAAAAARRRTWRWRRPHTWPDRAISHCQRQPCCRTSPGTGCACDRTLDDSTPPTAAAALSSSSSPLSATEATNVFLFYKKLFWLFLILSSFKWQISIKRTVTNNVKWRKSVPKNRSICYW